METVKQVHDSFCTDALYGFEVYVTPSYAIANSMVVMPSALFLSLRLLVILKRLINNRLYIISHMLFISLML